MKRKHEIKILKPETYFEFGVIVLIVKTLFSFSNVLPLPDILETVFTGLASILMFISIIKEKYSFRTLALYCLIFALSMFSSLMVGDFAIFVTVITVLACRGRDFDKEVSFILWWEQLVVFIQLIAFLVSLPLGVSPFTLIGGEPCVNFGFVHPNVMGILVSNMLCLWLWNNLERLQVSKLMMIMAIEVIIYLMTKCRTAMYLYIVILILIGLSKVHKKIIKVYSVVAAMMIPGLSIIMYYAISHRTASFSLLLNKYITGRVLLGAYAFERVGLTFLGRNVDSLYDVTWDEVWRITRFTFDNFYSMLMMKYGIVWLTLLTVVFWKLAKKNSLKIDIMLICFALYGITEVHGLNCYLFFPLLMAVFLFEKPLPKSMRTIVYR